MYTSVVSPSTPRRLARKEILANNNADARQPSFFVVFSYHGMRRYDYDEGLKMYSKNERRIYKGWSAGLIVGRDVESA